MNSRRGNTGGLKGGAPKRDRQDGAKTPPGKGGAGFSQSRWEDFGTDPAENELFGGAASPQLESLVNYSSVPHPPGTAPAGGGSPATSRRVFTRSLRQPAGLAEMCAESGQLQLSPDLADVAQGRWDQATELGAPLFRLFKRRADRDDPWLAEA